jgi:hypothetical protein
LMGPLPVSSLFLNYCERQFFYLKDDFDKAQVDIFSRCTRHPKAISS